jgi:hypothetical protein
MTQNTARGRVNPDQQLEAQGITGVAFAHYNYAEAALVEEAVRRGEGRLGRGGAFLCTTGPVHRPFAQGQVRRPHACHRKHHLVGKQRRR